MTRASFLIVFVCWTVEAKHHANISPYRQNRHNNFYQVPNRIHPITRPVRTRLSDKQYWKQSRVSSRRHDGARKINKKSQWRKNGLTQQLNVLTINEMSRNEHISPMSRQLTIDLPHEERTYTSSRPRVYSNFFETGNLKSTKTRVEKSEIVENSEGEKPEKVTKYPGREITKNI